MDKPKVHKSHFNMNEKKYIAICKTKRGFTSYKWVDVTCLKCLKQRPLR